MYSQEHRGRWWHGIEVAMGIGGMLGAISYFSFRGVTGYYNAELILWMLLNSAFFGLLWLPIAWYTWDPYVITPPGLNDED